ncbi:MAG: hypothetical protein ACFCUR_20930 [Rhodomicrobiaceae bacterium]
MIEVELPDGTIAEFPEGTPREIMLKAIAQRFPPEEPINVFDESIGALTRGVNTGIDAMVNLPYELIRSGAGLAGYDLPASQPLAGRLNVTPEPRTAMGRITQAVGEVGGSSALPAAGLLAKGASIAPAAADKALPIFRQAAQAPGLAAGNEAAAAVASGLGVGGAREADLGPAGELVAGLIGGVAGPTAVNMARRTAAPMGDAVRYGNRAVRNARNPEQAALDAVSDKMTRSGISADELMGQYVPPPSPEMVQRGVTNLDIAEMIMRIKAGEKPKTVAPDYFMTEQTARNYVTRFDQRNPTPTNILDIAAELKGAGKARPLRRLGRAAYSISDDGDAAQALLSRQDDQSGRVVTAIKRGGGGRDFESEAARYQSIVEEQASKAYKAAYADAKRFDLKPVIRKWRNESFLSAGRIKEKLDQAIDLFFSPVMVEGKSGPMRARKLGEPLADLRRFSAAREALDDMIKNSLDRGEPTRLTGHLSRFRTDINKVMRQNNPKFAKADDMFSGGKGAEALLKQGESLTTQLGSRSRDILKGYESLTPAQQELVRLGFLRKLQDRASSVTEGHSVAQRFRSDAAAHIIRKLFKGPAELQRRGEALLSELKREAITTQTKNEVLSGSRTAELGEDMRRLGQTAQAAADLATGRWGQLLANLSTRLKDQINEEAARRIMKILTETEPENMLSTLNRLAQSAKTAKQRQEYVTAIRELRAARPSYGVGMGTAITAGSEQ